MARSSQPCRALPSRREPAGPDPGGLHGAVVFCAMSYGTLPALSWVRTFYIPNAIVRWPGPKKWPQLLIHLLCVGFPIAWAVRSGASLPKT